VLPALTLLLLLVLPGSKYLWFDGLPLSNWPERIALVLLLAAIVPQSARTRLARLLEHQRLHGWGGTLLLVLLFAKLWSYFALPLGGGFEVCLRSLYAPVETCEKSYEATFLTRDGINALGSITRTEDHINFGAIDSSRPDTDQDTAGSTWNLPFTNDFPRLSELWLDRLPFRADIGTRMYSESDAYLPIQLVGDLKVSYSKGSRGELGTTETSYSSYETQKTVFMPVSSGEGVLRLRYEFKDGPIGAIPEAAPTPKGPYATLVLFGLVEAPNDELQSLLAPIPRDAPNTLVAFLLQLLNFVLVVVLVGFFTVVAGVRSLVLGVSVCAAFYAATQVIASTVAVDTSVGVVLLTVLLMTVFITVQKRPDRRVLIGIAAALGTALTVVQATMQRINGLSSLLPWDHLMFRGRDTDWLVYQGYARRIFLEESLRGGEATYYFTPGMRYVAFLQHLLFGDSDVVIAVVNVALLLSSTLLLFAHFVDKPQLPAPILIFAALLATWLRPIVLELTVSGAAEPVAWCCMLIATALLAPRKYLSSTSLLSAFALIGQAVFLRPNNLFAAIVIIVWALIAIDTSVITKVRATLILTVLLSLAFFHNLHFGESSTPFTVFVSLDRDLEVSEILHSVYDNELRAKVVDKIRFALSWGGGESHIGTSSITWITQAVWLYTVYLALRHRVSRNTLILLTAPVAYLMSMLPFRYTNVPVRHFVTLMLVFAITSVIGMCSKAHCEVTS